MLKFRRKGGEGEMGFVKKKIRNKPLVIRAFLFSLKKPKCFETFESETRFRAVTTVHHTIGNFLQNVLTPCLNFLLSPPSSVSVGRHSITSLPYEGNHPFRMFPSH